MTILKRLAVDKYSPAPTANQPEAGGRTDRCSSGVGSGGDGRDVGGVRAVGDHTQQALNRGHSPAFAGLIRCGPTEEQLGVAGNPGQWPPGRYRPSLPLALALPRALLHSHLGLPAAPGLRRCTTA